MAQVENPVKLDDDTVKKLEDAASLDCSVTESCLYANISRQTYYSWMESFPDLKERLDKLREKPFLKARQTIVKNLDNPDMAKWYMERKKKKEFAQRTEFTGSDGQDFSVRIIKFDEVNPHGNANNDSKVDPEAETGLGES